MKYFLIFLVSAASLISLEGKIPSYFRLCNRDNPQLSECVQNSIQSLRDKLTEGMPELEVPSIDPLYLKKVVLDLGPGFKAETYDLLLRGAKNYEIHNLVVDIQANTYFMNISIPEVTASGTYDINAKIGVIPLRGKGPINFIARSVRGQGTLHGKHVVRKGKTYNWFPSMDLKMEIADYNIKLENLFEGDPTIGEVTNKLLNQEKTEILASLLPAIEKTIIGQILVTANNIFKNFTWDEMFPKS